jgi:hypothetical protein
VLTFFLCAFNRGSRAFFSNHRLYIHPHGSCQQQQQQRGDISDNLKKFSLMNHRARGL